MASKLIRDFVYVDRERLYSLYSQVFGGVAELIVQSTLDNSTQTDSPSTMRRMLKPTLENQVAESSLRTENTILLDDIYNRLEEKIQTIIIEPKDVNAENYLEKLQNTFLIKVRGQAEIEDYDRAKQFTEKFNEICDTIAYASLFQTDTMRILRDAPENIENVKKELKTAQGARKKELQDVVRQFENLDSPDRITRLFAKELGLRQDDQFLSNMAGWFDFFYQDGFEITIIPIEAQEVVYRGVLEKENLRLTPKYLRSLFGGFVSAEWVIVGQVTYLPGTRPPTLEMPQELAETVEIAPLDEVVAESNTKQETLETEIQEPPNEIDMALSMAKQAAQQNDTAPLRDPVRGMFKALAQFDTMFFESKERKEVLVRPLAIYREFTFDLDNEASEKSD